MNEVLKVLKERRSIRAFRPEPLKKEDLDAIVEAGLYAPSAKNLQSTKLVVVRDAAVLARLERLNRRILGTPEGTPPHGAPEAIVVLSDSEYPNWLQDGSLVMGNLMNAAAALGVGSCWIGAPNYVDCGGLFEAGFAAGHGEFIAALTLGYPAEDPKPHKRKGGRYTMI